MTNKFVYVVLGAGRQGTASAYDFALWGDAKKVILADLNLEAAEKSAARINKMLDTTIAIPVQANASDPKSISNVLTGVDACLSAVPYNYNIGITETCVKLGVCLCDLGGNTDIAQQQHDFDNEARAVGISIIPNCGQVPGMGSSLMVYAIELLDEALDVYMWEGGIPQNPHPPFNYLLTFHIAGLTNEYAEPAVFLRDWKVTRIEPMTELEAVIFPEPIGKLEAFVTGGGTDTMPWTYEGKLRTLQNLTLRHPGHFTQLRAYYDLGLWDLKPIQIKEKEIIPRDVFHSLFEPKVVNPSEKDIVIVRIRVIGKKNGRGAEAFIEVIDYFDETTGFSAMERSTGWSAAIVAEMMVRKETLIGAGGVEKMVPAKPFVEELKKRGIRLTEQISEI